MKKYTFEDMRDNSITVTIISTSQFKAWQNLLSNYGSLANHLTIKSIEQI